MHLSVIIPAYNEEENFRRGTLDQVVTYLKAQKYSWEVILVNDGSGDNTLKLLESFASTHQQVKVLNNPHQGKALTVITGALAAHGDVVLFSDMDQATPISETAKILTSIKDYDIVIGSRTGRKGAPVFRQILAFGNVLLRTLILNLPYRDTQCGFKALRKQASTEIFSRMKMLRPAKVITGPAVDSGFDVELLYLGRKLGFKISEVPVEWHYQETRRVRFFYDMLSGIQGLFIVRWRSLTNAYKL